MSDAKSGLFPETYLGSVAQEMYRDIARTLSGEKVKSQVRSVATVLGIKHDLAVRARKGRLGARAFPTWWKAYRKWDADQKAIGQLEWRDLHERIARLEKLVDRDNPSTADKSGEPGPRSGLAAARHKASSR